MGFVFFGSTCHLLFPTIDSVGWFIQQFAIHSYLVLALCVACSATKLSDKADRDDVSGTVGGGVVAALVLDNTPRSSSEPWRLVWADEFDGPELNPDHWFIESGDGRQYGIPGWGNNELQWYAAENVSVRDGHLVIEARAEARNGKTYTSGRINTRDRVAFRYGRIEARIKLPDGQGMWPAFWLLPQNDRYGTWAGSGEIDILEAVNLGVDGRNDIHGTIHFGGPWPDNLQAGQAHIVSTSVVDQFHTYALEWDLEELRWYVDGQQYAKQTQWRTQAAPYPAPFDQPFYILLNLAVGGNWPGPPSSATVFPRQIMVDYVRVYSGD